MKTICALAVALGLSGIWNAIGGRAGIAHAQAPERLEALMIATGRGEHVPLSDERLDVAIDGQEASTTLVQTYRNGSSARIEGKYELRPGAGSHVDGFAYWNGEQKIVGEVFERDTARQVYDRVTTRRRDPGLLEQTGEGVFSFKVFPIEPNEKKKVEVRWTKWLERRGQTVHYRAPIGRGAEVAIQIVGPAKNFRSPTHRLHTENVPGGVRLRADNSSSATEIDLDYDIDEPTFTPDLYVHNDGAADGYFALSIATPQSSKNIQAKDVTIVIDKSGSMEGEPMEHADAAAAEMIRLLGDGDRVNVIAFSDEVDPLFRTPQPVSDVRKRAIQFAQGLTASGGTDIALALSTALKSQDRREGRPRIIVFMTDGRSDADRALKAAKMDTDDVRMFTLGLGKEVNRPLLQRLAAEKRGSFSYIEDARAIEPQVRHVAEHIAHPMLVDVTIELEGVQTTRLYPRTLPDLFAEDELVLTGRTKGAGTLKATIRGKLDGKPVVFTRSIAVGKTQRRWVGGLWAQSRIEHLQEELALNGEQAELKNELVELALAYNVVTPFTAFLAIPESELGEMAGTVAAAREKKAKILASHQDAAALGSTSVDKNAPVPQVQYQQSIDVSGSSQGMVAQNAPMPTAPTQNMPVPGRTFEAEMDAPSHAKRVAKADYDGDDDSGGRPVAASGEVSSQHHGCAGCASGGDARGSILLALVVIGAVRRRRTSKR
jgi:Ca-activated chloride channel family protein